MSDWKPYNFGNAPLQIIDGDRGRNYPKNHEFLSDGYCLFLNAKNVTKDGFDFGEVHYISKEKDEILSKGKVSRYDCVLTTRGTVGNVGFYNDKIGYDNIRINSGMVIIRPHVEYFLPSFLYHYLRSNSFKNFIYANVSGSAQPQLPIQDIKRFSIYLPPIGEQNRISELLSGLDDKIELNLEMNKTLAAMAKAIYKEWFVDFGPFRDGEFVDTELGPIPAGWEIKRIGEFITVTDFVANGSFKSLKDNVKLYDEPNYAYYIRLVDYHNNFKSGFKYVDLESYKFLRKSSLNGNETIISNVGANAGTVFKPPAWLDKPMTLGSNSIMMTEDEYSEYLYYYFKGYKGKSQLENILSGSAQPKFNKTDFRNLKVPLPDEATMCEYNKLVLSFRQQINSNHKENKYLTDTRDYLLPKLISGEIRVKEAKDEVKDAI